MCCKSAGTHPGIVQAELLVEIGKVFNFRLKTLPSAVQ